MADPGLWLSIGTALVTVGSLFASVRATGRFTKDLATRVETRLDKHAEHTAQEFKEVRGELAEVAKATAVLAERVDNRAPARKAANG